MLSQLGQPLPSPRSQLAGVCIQVSSGYSTGSEHKPLQMEALLPLEILLGSNAPALPSLDRASLLCPHHRSFSRKGLGFDAHRTEMSA